MQRPRNMLLVAATALFCALSLTACAPPGVDQLIIEDIEIGEGPEVQPGDFAGVHYTGWLYDPSKEDNRGFKFDSSISRGLPFTFQPEPGTRGVIEGWHQGVLGMRKGGVRVITIPPDLAYGDTGSASGRVPPDATLVFELELVRHTPKPRTQSQAQ